ncbi:MAG: hypothetical protein NTV51_16420 [Verrucomicrobia bacterium]|nr:hypothetical protein [Verrucomicrobiota bacterium]
MKSSSAPLLPVHSPLWGARARLAGRSRLLQRGVTLVEVLIASLVLTITCGGVLAMMIQSRRLTEGSIVQNSIVTVMQGYIEQMKSMEYGLLAVSPPALDTSVTLPTVKDADHPDALGLSWGSPPTTLPAIGTTPANAVDNDKDIIIKTPLKPDGTPAPITAADTIKLTVWVWVQDLTDLPNNVGGSKAVTIIYTYQFRDGGRIKSIRNSLRTIRSVVPSF